MNIQLGAEVDWTIPQQSPAKVQRYTSGCRLILHRLPVDGRLAQSRIVNWEADLGLVIDSSLQVFGLVPIDKLDADAKLLKENWVKQRDEPPRDLSARLAPLNWL